MWVGVRRERQREGLGRSLISTAFNESHARGAEIMSLYVAEDNDSAINLYKSLGFINGAYVAEPTFLWSAGRFRPPIHSALTIAVYNR